MYNIIYKCGEPKQGEPMKIEVLGLKCLRENAVLPKRSSRGFGSTSMQSQDSLSWVKRAKQRKRKLNLLNSEHNSGRYQAQWNQ